jgi:IclR family acetate operon transcriptional repressor
VLDLIASVEKALGILSALADGENSPITVSTLAKTVGINRSTCSHIVKTLVTCGYAQRVSHKDGYILGPESYCLSRFGRYDNEIIEVCQPIMNWLYKKTGFAVVLAVIANDEKYIIKSLDKEQKIFLKDESIRSDDIYRTATGRIILANMNTPDIKSIYAKFGNPQENEWSGIKSYDQLVEQLTKISKRDIVVTMHKINQEISVGLGGAIFKGHKCLGAVGLASMLSESEYENFPQREKELTETLKRGIAEINRRLNYVIS